MRSILIPSAGIYNKIAPLDTSYSHQSLDLTIILVCPLKLWLSINLFHEKITVRTGVQGSYQIFCLWALNFREPEGIIASWINIITLASGEAPK